MNSEKTVPPDKSTLMYGVRGQVTIFVIISIIVVSGILAYFVLSDNFSGVSVHSDLEPVYEYYLECLEENVISGARLIGEQGGYIEKPDFEPGSSFMPFSSELDFLGQGVPYWLYITGNNILKEQVPSKNSMERELAKYVGERTNICDFSSFTEAGYDVYVEEGTAEVEINDLSLNVKVSSPIIIHKGEVSSTIVEHNLEVSSKLGKFYKLAIEVYNFEKSELFLEKYAVDVMRLYAPVDGIEVSCAPKVFSEDKIKGDILDGIAANVPTIKIGSDYYDLSSDERDYFVSGKNLDIDENVNFMFDPSWPTKIEVYGDLVAEPVGLQEGLGILGFCYVPYHFVYDIAFPVMIQFYDAEELFQFPVAAIIDKSSPRGELPTTVGVSLDSQVCEFRNQEVLVNTFDSELNPLPAEITFKCLDSICPIGDSVVTASGEASLIEDFPQCVNGYIIARADGYSDSKYQISTNQENVANIILNKKHSIELDLGTVKKALVTFNSEDYTTTILYPEFTSVELVEGLYDITVTAYDSSSLVFPAVNDQRCVDVPAEGAGGFLGLETEKCFDLTIPETEVTFAVIGGGSNTEYFTNSDLRNSRELNINVPLFGLPETLDDLQLNQIAAENERIFVELE